MDFKQDFLTALAAGKGYESLMELVRRHRIQGLTLEAVYKSLQQIWLDHGFDESEGQPMQDDLETVMEKVWYGQPVVETPQS
ncbi:MAG TPA: hypothetical protein VE988_07265 [Gemmataceae bacterium]|nr:hypothetical protein [Gemmataceae bacterium]